MVGANSGDRKKMHQFRVGRVNRMADGLSVAVRGREELRACFALRDQVGWDVLY